MPSTSDLAGLGLPAIVIAGITAVVVLAIPSMSRAQTAAPGGTTAIQRDSDAGRGIREPSFQTREERLNTMPLDWNTTIGTPTPRREERRAVEGPGQTSAGGAPNPDAESEARRLYPNEWK